jgi:galactose oxidase-like protein
MVRSGILLVLTSLIALAQSGTFSATGNMSVPRQGHTATLLQNGKVLITGGASGDSGTVWASAELYDPSMGTFTATGNMATPRLNHTATLLPDGKVLIAGGQSKSGYPPSVLRSAELYDPSTGTFTTAADMATRRGGHSATLLGDGTVLIAGGYDFNGANVFISSAEIYDQFKGTFTATGNMITGRAGLSAALLPNGKVFIAAGHNGDDGPITRVEIYDPHTGAFGIAGETGFPSSVGPNIMNVLPGGQVLINMIFYDRTTPDTQLYDPASMTFTLSGSMTAQRSFSSTLLSTGTVLTAGGWSADVYDPATGVFTRAGDLITARTAHTATLLADGTVLLAGGSPTINSSSYLDSAERYRPANAAPAPFLYSLLGTSRGAILHAGTSRVVSPSDPATAGDALEVYGAGLLDGSVVPPQVVIGGRMAEVLFFGNAPAYAGLNQIDIRVPAGITPGPAVPVRMNYLSRPSNEVTLAVQ